MSTKPIASVFFVGKVTAFRWREDGYFASHRWLDAQVTGGHRRMCVLQVDTFQLCPFNNIQSVSLEECTQSLTRTVRARPAPITAPAPTAARTVATTMQAERHKRKTHGLRPRVLPIATDGVGHGVLQEPRLHGGSVSTADRALTLRGGARAYFAADLSDASSGEQPRGWSHLRYEQLKLRGRSLRFTADLSRVGCGCVAALYLVDMPDRPDAMQQRSGYCDAVPRRSGSGACVEIDLLEANSYGAHASLHTRAGRDADGSCNEAGCTVNWGNRSASAAGVPVARLFGRAAGALLNTRHPFGVEASVSARGELSALTLPLPLPLILILNLIRRALSEPFAVGASRALLQQQRRRQPHPLWRQGPAPGRRGARARGALAWPRDGGFALGLARPHRRVARRRLRRRGAVRAVERRTHPLQLQPAAAQAICR